MKLHYGVALAQLMVCSGQEDSPVEILLDGDKELIFEDVNLENLADIGIPGNLRNLEERVIQTTPPPGQAPFQPSRDIDVDKVETDVSELLNSSPEDLIDAKELVCHGDGSVTATIKLRGALYVYQVFAGTCEMDIQPEVDGSYEIQYSPFNCGEDESKIDLLSFSSYSSNVTIGFDMALYDPKQDQQLIISSYTFDAICSFENVYQTDTKGEGYTTNMTIDNLHMGEFTGIPIEFNITIYEDSSYSQRRDSFPTEAGSQLYYGITAFEGRQGLIID
jgi:hypothetical protein